VESQCLRHQGRTATKRCVSCLKPLCHECAQAYADGVYCSDGCHQAALETRERAAKIAQSDRELKEWQQKRMATNMMISLVVVAVLFFGWEYFPAWLTDNVEKFWNSATKAMGL